LRDWIAPESFVGDDGTCGAEARAIAPMLLVTIVVGCGAGACGLTGLEDRVELLELCETLIEVVRSSPPALGVR